MESCEVIVLAGGLGTRLRSVVPDKPKCMAEVRGIPFISYIIDYLVEQNFSKFIFSLGYKHELVEIFLQTNYNNIDYKVIIESDPLGTGGAIKLAAQVAQTNDFLVVNGDTLYKADIRKMYEFHYSNNAECSLILKPMNKFNRYGAVRKDQSGLITQFDEKKHYEKGLINGGIYMINRNKFLNRRLPDVFSFEKDYFEMLVSNKIFYGIEDEGYFIDIGIPEDFAKANSEL